MPLWERIEQWLAYIQSQAFDWGLRLLLALLILVLTRLLARRLGRALERLLSRGRLTVEMTQVIVRIARLVLVLLGLMAVLLVIGLGEVAASFLAGLGITGLIIGFALQDITKNLAAGLLLLFQQPFRIGETIRVKEFEGTVADLTLRATTIRTDDGRDVLIPNAEIYTSVIIHLKRTPCRRHSLTMLLNPQTPLGEALPALAQAAGEHGEVLDSPVPQVIVTSISGQIAVDVRVWLAVHGPDTAQTISQLAKDLHALATERGWS